ncbi:MAG: transposase [Shewanella sp.]
MHSEQFKSEALQLAAKIAVTSAAKQLNLSSSQFYVWRNAFRRKQSSSEREHTFAVEMDGRQIGPRGMAQMVLSR